MAFFPCAHAGHPLWQHAVKQVVVQLHAQITMQKLDPEPRLGLVYVSMPYAEHASAILSTLAQALPNVRHWVGCATASVLAGDMDYGSTGALAVLLPCLATQDYQVFSGMAPWQGDGQHLAAHQVLLHGDAGSSGVDKQLQALQASMPQATIYGGLGQLQEGLVQMAWGAHAQGSMPASIGGGGVQTGGVSGVVFGEAVEMFAVAMQGCKPVSSGFRATKVDGCALLEIDGQPAMRKLFEHLDLNAALAEAYPDAEMIWGKVRQTQLALSEQPMSSDALCIAPQARVRQIVALDPLQQAIVLDGPVALAHTVTFCQRDEAAARADMRRACAEVWEELTPELLPAEGVEGPSPTGRSICGAVYIRSQHRQMPARAPQVDAELQLIRHALGPVPLLGFTCNAEVDRVGLQHLSAQLIVFTQPLSPLL